MYVMSFLHGIVGTNRKVHQTAQPLSPPLDLEAQSSKIHEHQAHDYENEYYLGTNQSYVSRMDMASMTLPSGLVKRLRQEPGIS